MRNALIIKFIVSGLLIAPALETSISAQTSTESTKKVNFGYSQNPKTKTKTSQAENSAKTEQLTTSVVETSTTPVIENTVPEVTENSENPTAENKVFESRSAANKTLEVVKRASVNAVLPTEIYKVGIGDVLFISLQNVPAKASTYFTVLNDGTIDYPLANEMISVNGLTTEEIEDTIKSKIKLFENPQVSVKVREHSSHAVTVLGMVEKAGEIYLKREAIPLFMIRAEAIVLPKANLVIIKRGNQETEEVNLKDSKSDDVLIYPGDFLEFKSTENVEISNSSNKFYYIGGNIAAAGQKDFHQGLTLTQAILASGGLKKSNVKKVIIRRKNKEGLLSPITFDLNSIKNGKQPDPSIEAGDTIEIVN